MKLWFATLGICVLGIFLLQFNGTSAAFRDVSPYHEYREAIEYVAEQKIVVGYRNGRFFKPSQKLNRAEFMTMMMRLLFSAEELAECMKSYYERNYWYVAFHDVATHKWYAPSICIAYQSGIISGYADQTFRPHQKVTFAESVKILAQVLKIQPQGSGEWYTPYIQAFEEKQAIPPSIESINAAVKRSELAEVIYRLQAEITDRPSKSYAELTPPDPIPCDSCLVIAKLDIMVPIIFGVGYDAWRQEDWNRLEQELLQALENGVVHEPYTAFPGQEGNVFISGHSSYYRDLPGKYKEIFAKLEHLAIGDIFQIYYQGRKFEYQITEQKIVHPEDTWVLDQPSGKELATLMTCYPRYTNQQRLIFVGVRMQ